MEQKRKDAGITYWHPAFYADIQIELMDDADNLVFENEHQLGTNPMEIDVLIIKKETDRPVRKNIGRIFRKHNIVEYKSPGDSLNIDDFYKVYGYACFYKADVPFIDSIPIQELTITFVSEKYPRKLIQHLQVARTYRIEKTEAGIYQVMGDFIPIQIIVTERLSKEENLWLGSLTNKLDKPENAQRLVTDYMDHKENNLYRSVFETILRANKKTFEEVNDMDDIIMEIVQEKFDRKLKEEVEKEVKKELDKAVKKELDKAVKKELDKAVKKELDKETQKVRLLDRISLVRKKCAKSKPLSVIADEYFLLYHHVKPLFFLIFRCDSALFQAIYTI